MDQITGVADARDAREWELLDEEMDGWTGRADALQPSCIAPCGAFCS